MGQRYGNRKKSIPYIAVLHGLPPIFPVHYQIITETFPKDYRTITEHKFILSFLLETKEWLFYTRLTNHSV